MRALPTYKVDIAQDRREQPAENVAIAGRQDDGGRGGHRQTSKLWLMGGAQRAQRRSQRARTCMDYEYTSAEVYLKRREVKHTERAGVR